MFFCSSPEQLWSFREHLIISCPVFGGRSIAAHCITKSSGKAANRGWVARWLLIKFIILLGLVCIWLTLIPSLFIKRQLTEISITPVFILMQVIKIQIYMCSKVWLVALSLCLESNNFKNLISRKYSSIIFTYYLFFSSCCQTPLLTSLKTVVG